MNNTIRASVIAALALSTLAAGSPAMADTLYASAGYAALPASGEPGDYLIDSGSQNLLAATFTLAQTSQITGIGGVFSTYGDGGSIFGAIIAAPQQQTNVTSSTLSSLALGHTVFAPPTDGSDATAAMSLVLGPGTYELLFGSGLWGTSGNSGLASGMNGQANLLQSVDGGQSWGTLSDSVRVTVTGSPVPLPAGLPLLASGVAALGGLLRRRSRGEATDAAAAVGEGRSC